MDFLLKSGADETVTDDEGKTAVQRLDQGALNPNLYYTEGGTAGYYSARHARKLLANAPAGRANRRWRRRALLVMCIARHRRGEAQLLDEAAG